MTEDTTPARNMNRLTNANVNALYDYVRANEAALRHLASDVARAEAATATLGFPVTDSNIKGAKKVLGIEPYYGFDLCVYPSEFKGRR